MKYVRIYLVCLMALLSIACKEETPVDTSSLHLVLEAEAFSNTRCLSPAQGEFAIASYHISGTGPNNRTFALDVQEQELTINHLAIGTWHLHAQARNKDGVPLVEGDMETFLSKVTTSATINMNALVGTGTLDVGLTWDSKQVASNAYLETTLLDQGGNPVSLTVPPLKPETGNAQITTSLASGSYLLQLRLFSQGVLVSGATEAVRILDGTTSSGTLSLVIGDLSTSFMISLINDTMLPIEGTITASPAEPVAGETVTLTFTPTNLESGMAVNDLTIDWYCEGVSVQQDSRTLATIPQAGTHRYDVVVRHSRLGSLGSATLLVTMPYAP